MNEMLAIVGYMRHVEVQQAVRVLNSSHVRKRLQIEDAHVMGIVRRDDCLLITAHYELLDCFG